MKRFLLVAAVLLASGVMDAQVFQTSTVQQTWGLGFDSVMTSVLRPPVGRQVLFNFFTGDSIRQNDTLVVGYIPNAALVDSIFLMYPRSQAVSQTVRLEMVDSLWQVRTATLLDTISSSVTTGTNIKRGYATPLSLTKYRFIRFFLASATANKGLTIVILGRWLAAY